MGKKHVTYARSGVGGSYGSKEEKTDIIRNALTGMTTPKDKYSIGGIGGFAGMFDLGSYLEDKNKETREEERKRKMQVIMSYLTREYGEKRAPYVFAGYWLKFRLEQLNEMGRK